MANDFSDFRPDLSIFGVPRLDPGWIYLIKSGALFKIGKTTQPARRVRNALTWAPDIEVLAMKPFWNISYIEHKLHEGLADCWHKGEWFSFPHNADRELIIEGLQGFYEKDRDANSVNFIYWYNGSGMLDFCIERHHRKVSLRRFQQELVFEKMRSTSDP